MERCGYCGLVSGDLVDFHLVFEGFDEMVYGCDEDCLGRVIAYYVKAWRLRFGFWLGIGASVLLCFMGVFVLGFAVMGLFLLGVTMALFPFATPETVGALGVKKAVRWVRFAAGFVFCWLLFFGWFFEVKWL